jgi:hypothetical protein
MSRRCSANIFALTTAVIAMGFLELSDAQNKGSVELSVEGARPVAKAVETLQLKYGWIITYEDPKIAYEGDLVDETAPAAKDLRFRAVRSRNGRIDISYPVSLQTDKPEDPLALIQMVLDANVSAGNPGTFRLVQTGGVFHVVPAEVKNSEGRWTNQSLLLDVPISLPEKERSGGEIMAAICAAVGQATQTRVVVGTVPANLFGQYRGTFGVHNEPARDALLRFITALKRKLTCYLFYGPDVDMYALNIDMLPEAPVVSNEPPAATNPTQVAPAKSRRNTSKPRQP